jgi:hypothetical protein
LTWLPGLVRLVREDGPEASAASLDLDDSSWYVFDQWTSAAVRRSLILVLRERGLLAFRMREYGFSDVH